MVAHPDGIGKVDGKKTGIKSRCSSVVEHFLGKEEVDSSILFNGSEETKETNAGRAMVMTF